MNYNIEYLLRYVSNDTYKKILKNKSNYKTILYKSQQTYRLCYKILLFYRNREVKTVYL